MAMMSNVATTMKTLINCNPFSKTSALLVNNQIISHKLSKWLKFINLFTVMILGSVKDEMCFFTISFIKNNLRNQIATHLNLVLCMYAQTNYSLDNFP
jgi:hypothetical protein